MRGGGIKVLSKIFCFTGPKIFVRDPLCVSEIFKCGKKLWIRDGEGDITFSVENFLPSSAAKLRADHQCFRKFRVSKYFTHKKVMSLFSVDFFCITEAKICLLRNFWYRKFSCIGAGMQKWFVEAFSFLMTEVVYKKAYDTSRAGRILIWHQPSNTITTIQITRCIIIQ